MALSYHFVSSKDYSALFNILQKLKLENTVLDFVVNSLMKYISEISYKELVLYIGDQVQKPNFYSQPKDIERKVSITLTYIEKEKIEGFILFLAGDDVDRIIDIEDILECWVLFITKHIHCFVNESGIKYGHAPIKLPKALVNSAFSLAKNKGDLDPNHIISELIRYIQMTTGNNRRNTLQINNKIWAITIQPCPKDADSNKLEFILDEQQFTIISNYAQLNLTFVHEVIGSWLNLYAQLVHYFVNDYKKVKYVLKEEDEE